MDSDLLVQEIPEILPGPNVETTNTYIWVSLDEKADIPKIRGAYANWKIQDPSRVKWKSEKEYAGNKLM